MVGVGVSVTVGVSDGSAVNVLVGVAGTGEGVSEGAGTVAVGGRGVEVAGCEVSVGDGLACGFEDPLQPAIRLMTIVVNPRNMPAR